MINKDLIRLIALLTDAYKLFHRQMYPIGTVRVYSNSTARSSKHYPGKNKGYSIVANQPLVKMLRDEWELFFKTDWEVLEPFIKQQLTSFTGADYDIDHLKYLHDLGYLPLVIKSLPDGSKCPIGVPDMTFYNTDKKCFWLTNYLETWLSNNGWMMSNSATLANEFREIFEKWALKTVGNIDFVPLQGHDFSMRGMAGTDAAIQSGIGHLTSFIGSDTVPAYLSAQYLYNTPMNDWSNFPAGIIATSVPATEHSVQCAHWNEKAMNEAGYTDELEYLDHILATFPTGIISIVCDGMDFFGFITKTLPLRKTEIMKRQGKIVVRPDSGDPADIICGLNSRKTTDEFGTMYSNEEYKGAIEILWDEFGGTTTEKGYRLLDDHIGLIYGDSINLDRAENICSRLADKGFASINWVAGIGSFTYQFNTRDTLGRAYKATYVEIEQDNKIIGKNIFKDPKTGTGFKKSAKGLLHVGMAKVKGIPTKVMKLYNEVTWEQENIGLLRPIFIDGNLENQEDLFTVRKRIRA